MKNIRLILILLWLCGISYAQDNKPNFTLDDGCGNPMVESQLYESREGKVTKIINANTIILEQSVLNGNKVKGTYTVELVGIDSSKNKKKIIEFLKKYILNQNVEVTGNLRNKSDKKFKGLIFAASEVDDIDWVNDNLLELGIAKYKNFSSDNLIPYNKPCQLEKAEARAKEAKFGIWAK
jgi:hypothetical protein